MRNCTVSGKYDKIPICCEGGRGTLLGGGYPFPGIDRMGNGGLIVIYLLLLLWMFTGVALAADVFMAAIEQITSSHKDVTHTDSRGVTRRFRVKVWNDTIANLTLMALGSSAPEILLSLIELLFDDFYSGKLGPSTIVGSAAFNLMVIIAVCIVSIPANDTREIRVMPVFLVTATVSTLAYVWLVIILMDDMIFVWEAAVTFVFFPCLVYIAYLADRYRDPVFRSKHPLFKHIAKGKQPEVLTSSYLLDVKNPDGSALTPEELLGIVKQLRTTHLANVPDDKAATLIAQQMASRVPKSRAYYRVNATRKMMGESHTLVAHERLTKQSTTVRRAAARRAQLRRAPPAARSRKGRADRPPHPPLPRRAGEAHRRFDARRRLQVEDGQVPKQQ